MLIMLMGLPASGKSTKAREIKYNIKSKMGKQAVILSSDEIREEICGDIKDQSSNATVFNILYKRMEQLLSKDKIVIFDATNLTIKNRAKSIEIAKKYNAQIDLFFMNISLDTCLKRNEERERHVPKYAIKRMAKNIQPPTREEGFDYIEIIIS